MRMIFALLLLAAALPGCAQEVVAVHDRSFASQFSQLNKNGWAVNRNDSAGRKGVNPNDPNVRVLREANWTGLRFNTNFHVDDPEIRAQLEQQNAQDQPQSSHNPTGGGFFGPAPRTSGK